MERPTAEYVGHEAGRLLSAVAVPPDAGFERAKPIKGEGPPIAARARVQHEVFLKTLKDNRVDVIELVAEARLGLATLVRSTALALPGGVVIARLIESDRRGEIETVRALLEKRGVKIVGAIEGPGAFDARDAIVMGQRLVVAKTATTNAFGIEQLAGYARQAGLELREAILAPGVQHLGDAFSPVDAAMAIAVPAWISGPALEGIELVAMPPELGLATGSLALGPRHVVMDLRLPKAARLLKKAKIFVEAIDLYDFGRAGAGPWTLVLPLRRAPLR